MRSSFSFGHGIPPEIVPDGRRDSRVSLGFIESDTASTSLSAVLRRVETCPLHTPPHSAQSYATDNCLDMIDPRPKPHMLGAMESLSNSPVIFFLLHRPPRLIISHNVDGGGAVSNLIATNAAPAVGSVRGSSRSFNIPGSPWQRIRDSRRLPKS